MVVEREGAHTSIVLLLLVVVAQLAFALGCHATLGLHHLLGLIGTRLVTLVCIVILEIGGGMRALIILIGHRVVTGRHGSRSAWVCWLVSSCRGLAVERRTKVWEGARAARHGVGFATTATAEHLAALDQVVDGTVDLCPASEAVNHRPMVVVVVTKRAVVGTYLRTGS